jgi:3-oxoacyl-[acyl-carrier protein] reductase
MSMPPATDASPQPIAPGSKPIRTVLVTGGSRGLGLAICRTLALAGYRVVAVARSASAEIDRLIHELESEKSGLLHLWPFDLTALDDLHGLVRSVRSEFGPIYGLVNNAGIGTGGVLATMPNDKIEQLVRLNTVSPLILCKYAVRSMMASGGGRIVNISSIVSFTGYSGLAAYAATKASLLGLTRALAREVGPLGITVNTVAPGFIDTEMTQELGEQHREQIARRSALKRMATADDIAYAVEFLLSDKAKNITGTVLTVDAGGTA